LTITVIAFDGTTLVADGRCTRGDGSLVSDCFRKLHKIRIKEFGGDCVIGLAGATDAIGPFLRHLEKEGITPMEYFLTDTAAELGLFHLRGIAVNTKGQCFEFSSDGGWCEVNGAASIGSGEIIAQHYLIKGCDARTAVLETCTTELTCGGILTTYDWKTGKFTEIRP
jgi:hypothetical protein